MKELQLMVLGFLPGVFWLWVLRRRDDHEPEPLRLVLLLFVLGIASALLVLYSRGPLEGLMFSASDGRGATQGPFLDALLLTAPLEEICKMLAFVIGILWNEELDEPLDGIIYGTAVGLGFASAENTLYIMREWRLDHVTSELWLLRGFTSTLIHVGATGLVGFCLTLGRLRKRRRPLVLGSLGLLIAIGFHGAYNYCLSGERELTWVSLLVVLPLLLILLSAKIRSARAESESFHDSPDA